MTGLTQKTMVILEKFHPNIKKWVYVANWLVDLHSNQPESKVRNPPDEIDLKSSNLGSIGWGYQHDYYSLMKDFFDKYYAGKEILANFDKVDRHLHARVFQLGLLWYRPIEKSIEFVQNFSDYLKSVQFLDITPYV